MRRLAALALLLVGAAPAPAPMRVFVEQGIAPGKRTEVLMLSADGAYKGLSSIAKVGRRGRGLLNTNRGYWLHCGSWRSLADGRVAVHRQLVESFSFLPPPHPGDWFTTVFTPVPGTQARRMTADGKTFALVARTPLDAEWASGELQACDVARRREPSQG